jgi:TonB family protein
MKSDILLSGVTAVAIHAFIFCVPLSKTKNKNIHAHIYKPIPISIISLQETVAAVPPVQASAQAPSKSRFETRSHMSVRETVISKKKPRLRKLIAARNMTVKQNITEHAKKPELAAIPDNQQELVKETFLDQMPIDGGKGIVNSSHVKTDSTGGHILRRVQGGIGPPQGNRASQDNIVYARPRYKENPLPHYPEVARRKGYEGKTLLRVKVLENGKAGKIEVEESSGFNVLDAAALRSVRGWTFVPGTINGKRTEQWIRVPVRFVLK